MRTLTLLFLLVVAGGCLRRTPSPPASIGVATMTPDSTIIVDLRAEGSGGMVGHARFVYPPDHPRYQQTLKHLGGLRPGESKPVPPWP